MSKQNVGLDDVREIALALPDVEESTTYGGRSFKVHGRLFVCQAVNLSAEPGSLVVRVEHSLRDELLATEPDVYYLTPHYESYSCVLVRLERIRREALERLLGIACLFVSSSVSARGTRRKSKSSAERKSSRRRP